MANPCYFWDLDQDDNGYIDTVELGHVMATLGEDFSSREIKDMIEEADLNGDGVISFEGNFAD